MKPLVITHGGAGAPSKFKDGCRASAELGLTRLDATGDPLEAVVAAAVHLEDDPRFNAGTGSGLRLDGRTIQMDAAVMNSDGHFGAVMALERTKNPILVARAVADTPHLMIAGEGALRLARKLGHPDYDPVSERAREKYAHWKGQWRAILDRRAARGAATPDEPFPDGPLSPESPWVNVILEEWWNFPEEFRAKDTIGAVARGRDGRYAVANSTGGTSVMLLGRVGDSPIFGAGLYAGPAGAVAATGEGEEIIRRILCYKVYERMAGGASAEYACRVELEAVPHHIAVGLIAAGEIDAWGGSNRHMPWAVAEGPG